MSVLSSVCIVFVFLDTTWKLQYVQRLGHLMLEPKYHCHKNLLDIVLVSSVIIRACQASLQSPLFGERGIQLKGNYREQGLK